MEDFITDIYEHAFVISNLKEFISLTNQGRLKQARELYNKTALMLEAWLNTIAASDPPYASSIQAVAIRVTENYDDQCLCKGLIEGQLIPALYRYMASFNTIDVSEGGYSLRSTDTGFLTILDDEIQEYMHDIHDPMHEAYRIVGNLYKPEMKGFIILGCGLGYQAYQLYHQSDGAIRIHLYDEDEVILDYALKYGVLSLIPDDNIEVIHIPIAERLAERFIKDIDSNPSYGYYIAPFKRKTYNGVCGNELDRIAINLDHMLDSAHLSAINLWKNKEINRIPFSAVAGRFKYKEYAVISAGPSFDDSIDFLRNCKGAIGLIAVNTVLRRLLNEGIIPDIIVAADPGGNMPEHLKGIEESSSGIILIADWLLNWKYSTLYRGDICFVRTNASAALTEDFLPDEAIWDISGTVSCMAVEAAVSLGAVRIYLVGQDLAYPSGQMYAKGMPHANTAENAKWDIMVPSVNGEMVYSCEAFEWFRKALEFQIRKYNNVDFINMSKIGALIKGANPPVSPQ